MSAHSLYENCENLQAYLLLKVYEEATETIYNLTFNSVNMLLRFHVAFHGRFSHVMDVKIFRANFTSCLTTRLSTLNPNRKLIVA